MIPTFDGIVRKGKLKVFNEMGIKRHVASFADGTAVTVTIKDKATESSPMRKYYFSTVVYLIKKTTGHGRDALHEAFKRKYLAYTDEETGLEMVPSVFGKKSTMTKKEKWDFIDDVRHWASDWLELNIPGPDKNWRKAA